MYIIKKMARKIFKLIFFVIKEFVNLPSNKKIDVIKYKDITKDIMESRKNE